jgi:hypothetical protein
MYSTKYCAVALPVELEMPSQIQRRDQSMTNVTIYPVLYEVLYTSTSTSTVVADAAGRSVLRRLSPAELCSVPDSGRSHRSSLIADRNGSRKGSLRVRPSAEHHWSRRHQAFRRSGSGAIHTAMGHGTSKTLRR